MTSEEIVSNGKDISLNPGADKANFCTIWPQVKQGLELLRGLTKNPIVKGVISVVESGGDAVAGMVCNK